MAKKSKKRAAPKKRGLLHGYTRLQGSAKRVRTPDGKIISDRAYNNIVNEKKIVRGERVRSQRAKAIKKRISHQPNRTKGELLERIREGKAVKWHRGHGNNYQIYTDEALLRQFLNNYKDNQPLPYAPEIIDRRAR